MQKPPFPFSAIVGQDSIKRALMIAAVDNTIGGVLILGDRGTGKSTAIRGLARLLPKIETVRSCRYHCPPDAPATSCQICNVLDKKSLKSEQIATPIVDLPLGVTEDRVCGMIDIEKALTTGEKSFEPGLLASAHRGFLYIDEVNLLEDHMVDLLLDVAASGINIVERDGMSIRHPARFVLVGSGNPEEGDLRPQMLDRFGLSVDVTSPDNVKDRIEIVRRRDAYEQDPVGFSKKWQRKDTAERKKIESARERMVDTIVSDEIMELVTRLCMALGVDGLRGELTLMRAARVEAALAGRESVSTVDVRLMAPMALRHRLRRDPLEEASGTARIDRALEELGLG